MNARLTEGPLPLISQARDVKASSTFIPPPVLTWTKKLFWRLRSTREVGNLTTVIVALPDGVSGNKIGQLVFDDARAIKLELQK